MILTPQIETALKTVEESLRQGFLTPTTRIDDSTFILFIETLPQGEIYHQYPFEMLPPVMQAAFKGLSKGGRVNVFKIVAVFDAWGEVEKQAA